MGYIGVKTRSQAVRVQKVIDQIDRMESTEIFKDEEFFRVQNNNVSSEIFNLVVDLPRWARNNPDIVLRCYHDHSYRADIYKAAAASYKRLLTRDAKIDIDIYISLKETAHGKRYWTYDEDRDAETMRILGPATMGPNGYRSRQAAAEALAGEAEIDLDDPETW